EFRWIHTMGSIVRTRVYATGLGVIMAEITRCCLDARAGNFPSRMRGIVEFHRERMEVDIAVRAVVGAEAASDAPVFNDDFEGISAADRTYGAAHHAQRVAALPAGGGDQVF